VHSESLKQSTHQPAGATKTSGFFVFMPVFEEDTQVEIAFAKAGGLVPAIVQDALSGDVLMLGFMNEQALSETRRTGEVVFYSRSRERLWKKGESSGHILKVRDLLVDCDADAILVRVDPLGPGVCHEGYRSCFFRRMEPDGSAKFIAERAFSPELVYGAVNQR
jgi:phosphoribosyl-AMP cyclohydrolase